MEFCKNNDIKMIYNNLSVPTLKNKEFRLEMMEWDKINWISDWTTIITYDSNYDNLLNERLKINNRIFDIEWFRQQTNMYKHLMLESI